MPRVTYVTLATGFNVILNEYMAAKRFDLKHGVNIDVINSYVSVTNYYNDFTAGTFELGIGAWDTWAARFLAGVPLQTDQHHHRLRHAVCCRDAGRPEIGR